MVRVSELLDTPCAAHALQRKPNAAPLDNAPTAWHVLRIYRIALGIEPSGYAVLGKMGNAVDNKATVRECSFFHR